MAYIYLLCRINYLLGMGSYKKDIRAMNDINFQEAIKLIRKEIEWTENNNGSTNMVSIDYYNGYICGLNQAINLLTCLLEIDEQLDFYDVDISKFIKQLEAKLPWIV